MKKTLLIALLVSIVVLGANFASADEGMWLLNNLPAAQLQAKYNFTPTPEWVEKVQKSSARLPNCSASFVSEDGLIMTNGHCAENAVQALSTANRDLYANGFYAKTRSEELKSGLTLMVLEQIGLPYEITKGPDTRSKCETVKLYQGAVTESYCYKVYDDVRLVFSSEKNTWFFGGDADNFEYPRFAMDVAFLRAYENGKPVKTPLHFKWSKAGAKEGELIFVSGHPGRTARLLTSSALETERDVRAPFILDLARRRELTTQQYMLRGKEQQRIAQADLFSWQNTRKLYVGKIRGLQNSELIQRKEQNEAKALADAKAKSPELAQQLQDGRKLVAEAQEIRRVLFPKVVMFINGLGFDSRLFSDARSLLSDEGQALLEEHKIIAPLDLEYEEAKLKDSLSQLIEVMGSNDTNVQAILNKFGSGPEKMAHSLIHGTSLSDFKECERLVMAGEETINKSKDPMLELVRLVFAGSASYTAQWRESAKKEQQGYSKIADVLFRVYGTTQYPDATFTLRLSFGTVKGYEENGKQIPSSTTIGGAYKHSADFGNAGDWQLPSRWLTRKKSVNLNTPLDFVSDLDITGGNSGSPVFNKALEIVGLVFDGNIQSLVSDYDYGYSPRSRAVSVHSAGITEILKDIYKADALVKELTK